MYVYTYTCGFLCVCPCVRVLAMKTAFKQRTNTERETLSSDSLDLESRVTK